MDTLGLARPGLLGAALEAVGALGLGIRVVTPLTRRGVGAPDTVIALRYGGREVRYTVVLRRGLRPATLGAVIHQLRAGPENPLLVADHVTPALADSLRTERIEFIDTAGNAFLNRPPLLVFVKGRRPPSRPAQVEGGRAFQAGGLRVLFALLARPELVARPYREIAAQAGVAHGTVGWVMAEMPGLGYVAVVGGRRRLTNGERLLGQWAEAFARTLRPRLLLGRFSGELGRLEDRLARREAGVVLGGEPAAARLTRHLRPATATLYAEAVDPDLVVDLQLRADPQGNVDIRRRFWAFSVEVPGLAPAVLVYADLLAIGDARCLETASLLRGEILDRLV